MIELFRSLTILVLCLNADGVQRNPNWASNRIARSSNAPSGFCSYHMLVIPTMTPAHQSIHLAQVILESAFSSGLQLLWKCGLLRVISPRTNAFSSMNV